MTSIEIDRDAPVGGQAETERRLTELRVEWAKKTLRAAPTDERGVELPTEEVCLAAKFLELSEDLVDDDDPGSGMWGERVLHIPFSPPDEADDAESLTLMNEPLILVFREWCDESGFYSPKNVTAWLIEQFMLSGPPPTREALEQWAAERRALFSLDAEN